MRFWPEETTGGRIEWRGKLQHVSSGETIYFRDWETLLGFLQSALGSYAGADGRGFEYEGGASQLEKGLQSEPAELRRDDDEANR